MAKNYLTEQELKALSLIVEGYLDFAELMAERHQPMTMEDWATHLDRVLEMSEHDILTDAGKISAEVAHEHALNEFQKYRIAQDRMYQSDFDVFLLEEGDPEALIKDVQEKAKQVDLKSDK